jgi:hypothetical protein
MVSLSPRIDPQREPSEVNDDQEHAPHRTEVAERPGSLRPARINHTTTNMASPAAPYRRIPRGSRCVAWASPPSSAPRYGVYWSVEACSHTAGGRNFRALSASNCSLGVVRIPRRMGL